MWEGPGFEKEAATSPDASTQLPALDRLLRQVVDGARGAHLEGGAGVSLLLPPV